MESTNRLSTVRHLHANRLRLEEAAVVLRELAPTNVGRHSEPLDYAQAVQALDNHFALDAAVCETRNEIERALARFAAGVYGRCEDCSEVIARDRLRVLPETTRCLSCQRAEERRLGKCV